MRPLRLIAGEARRVEGYRSERHVSLLALLVTELVDYGTLSERLDTQALADAVGAFARAAADAVEARHDGLVVRCGGGRLLAVFDDPTSAVQAAWALHGGTQLSLRTGIHLGQVALERVGVHLDVFGRHMHRTSCVATAARAGEILVTEAVADNTDLWLEATHRHRLAFAPRGRVKLEGIDDPLALFGVAEASTPAATENPSPEAYIELEVDARRMGFDAGVDRRILIGRSSVCDIAVRSSSSSKKHAMILCEGTQWLLCDLGSTNGTEHNGRLVDQRQPLQVGDRIGVGDAIITVTHLRHASGSLQTAAHLRIDLVVGVAHFDDEPLPLSAAELVWFAYLATERMTQTEGWVIAGQDGHEAFGAFSRPLGERAWATTVRTRPLLELMEGRWIDDGDLRNLRGKTVQKLKRFAAEHRGATALVPESDGRHRQRLPIAPARIAIVDIAG